VVLGDLFELPGRRKRARETRTYDRRYQMGPSGDTSFWYGQRCLHGWRRDPSDMPSEGSPARYGPFIREWQICQGAGKNYSVDLDGALRQAMTSRPNRRPEIKELAPPLKMLKQQSGQQVSSCLMSASTAVLTKIRIHWVLLLRSRELFLCLDHGSTHIAMVLNAIICCFSNRTKAGNVDIEASE